MTTALILIFLSAAVHAVANVLTKSADDKYAMRLLTGWFSVAIVAPFLFLVPLPHGAGPVVPGRHRLRPRLL